MEPLDRSRDPTGRDREPSQPGGAGGPPVALRTPPDMLVGIDPTRPRRDHTTDLPVGSTLVLYTDGLIERRSTGQDIDEGTTALGRTLTGLQHLPADAILDRVLDPVRYDREDDIAALAIRVVG
ncbi:PP2C family protein-serine/threonine phosphatase [Geodermatophilus obscurus]|uniref:PP2C family protein-serine/threonine phosphatase n=1 Tax=Geodermatophilus obscurus TaxID=1861 RepID=UPI002441CDD1|nr:SpoIIE family protein phosphatase [Geodermatophilus obscurus]